MNKPLKVQKRLDPNVVILKLFPGMTKNVLEAILGSNNLKGVVLETFGAGNCSTEPWFVSLLKKAIDNGIHIINVTQCISGSVVMGHYETSSQLKEIGVISGQDITTESAVCKLMYLLGSHIPSNEFKLKYEVSLRGEML